MAQAFVAMNALEIIVDMLFRAAVRANRRLSNICEMDALTKRMMCITLRCYEQTQYPEERSGCPMEGRCRICGTPVYHVKICNHCQTVREERRFMKMVTREELKETRALEQNRKMH
jgi:hypothetical protein